MKKISFPYGKTNLDYAFDEKELAGVLTSSIEEYVSEMDGRELVRKALEFPEKSAKLSELAKGKEKVVIIASDHTRPVPSKIIMPEMLSEIRKGNPNADITILIATGCHRGTTKKEWTLSVQVRCQ
jgi:nickel-dependent lactate racemase